MYRKLVEDKNSNDSETELECETREKSGYDQKVDQNLKTFGTVVQIF